MIAQIDRGERTHGYQPLLSTTSHLTSNLVHEVTTITTFRRNSKRRWTNTINSNTVTIDYKHTIRTTYRQRLTSDNRRMTIPYSQRTTNTKNGLRERHYSHDDYGGHKIRTTTTFFNSNPTSDNVNYSTK
ncbi:unnamed protein product [Macrosiphum euphorbiae]|uniref:Uncharacterized protein n=1 Tax=Macrosiphum euphorbiae TaxID=13131 RepID=A0AAV0WEC0_9HEMI|nr:unnamed protein product [Macrosiphum euphorbiae]